MPNFADSGRGQGVGCFEFGGFDAIDPATYKKFYNLPDTPVIARNVARL